MKRKEIPALLCCLLLAAGLSAQQAPMLKVDFDPSDLPPDRIGRGECIISGGLLHTRDAYACFGDTNWRNYQFSFRAMAPLPAASAASAADARGRDAQDPAGNGEVHICAGFRANNRDDRYILGLKGGSFNALYLERLGFMGTDDYLALRPLAFPVRPGEWYRFRVQVAGDRMRIFLGDEALPRIDIRDANASLCPQGRVTLGGSYIEAVYDNLDISPLKENALDGQPGEARISISDREKLRQKERAAYQPLRLAALAGSRTEISLDGNWLFRPGYELHNADDAILPTKEDRSWHVMHVPDFWNPSRVWLHGEKYKSESKGASDKYYQKEIERCLDQSFDYTRTDIGWYRQWIDLPAGVRGKHMELSFDAVSKVAEVWVNGHKAGGHIGMFGNFSLDVSALLHPGSNLVTVRVLRNYVNDIRDADKIADVAVTVEVTQRMIKDLPHGFYVDDPAGIWQPVKLTVTDPLHIADVFIRPGISGASFEVSVRNDGKEDRSFSLHTGIVPVQTDVVPVHAGIVALYNGISAASVTLKAGQEQTLTYSVSGLHPHAWSPEDPHLYHFRFSIVSAASTGAAAGDPVDSVSLRSGFRTFEAKDGFFWLNGRRYWLRGANQTAMPLGPNDAALADRFCGLLHDAHVNATRTHTVPFTETWMDAADRGGIGVSYEGTWPWLMIQGTMPDSSLLVLWEREWLDLLKKYRNHPSLLLWTVNNEMKFYDNDPDAERARTKMRIISRTVSKMRKIDPTRPVVFDSNYKRNKKKFGESFLQEIDDGDADDIHMYPNWYDNSIFDQFKGEFQARSKNEGRPLISQEMSTGYSNNESGHPVRFYTFVHQTPQALVGKYAYDHSDPSVFLRTHAFITKELAEAFRRTDDQASGILHFASITWFRYVYSADSIRPYPVYYAMQKALQPLLVSAELWGRHFYAGAHMPVRVCIVNDQDETVLSSPSTLHWSLETPAGSVIAAGEAPVDTVGYYGRRWLAPDIRIPAGLGSLEAGQKDRGGSGAGRQDAKLVLRLMRGGTLLSSNDYDIVLAPRSWVLPAVAAVSVVDGSGRLPGLLDTLGVPHKDYGNLEAALAAMSTRQSPGPLVISGLNAGNASNDDLARIRAFVSDGGRVLLLNPGTMAASLYPQYIKGVLDAKGEIMNMDIPESSLFDGLEPLDLRYFNNDRRESPAVCAGAFQVVRQANLSAPASFTRVHGYLQGDIGQREAALEKLRGFPIVRIDEKGSIILSQVLLDKAATDPVAGRLLANMIGALK